MAVQISRNNSNVPFVQGGQARFIDDAVILQDAGRTAILVYGTVMAKISASQKWTPFIDETAVDGTAIPQGIYVGNDIPAADLVAGDISDSAILAGAGCMVARDQITIENSKTLATVITVGTTDLRTVEDQLANRGIYVEDTVDISEFENA